MSNAKFHSLDELLEAVDEKTGNSFYGDLWRLALKAKECVHACSISQEMTVAAEESLDQAIKKVEECWL